MADYNERAKPRDGESAPELAKEIIDVLVRGLNTATESLDPTILAAGGVCIGYYGDPGHTCLFWYSHQQ
jgi:hypothetical protein